MATTAGISVQLTRLASGKKNVGAAYGGGLKAYQFDFVQGSGAGATGSTVDLVRIPPGRWYLYAWLSAIEFTAFGSGVTGSIGYTAYTAVDGSAVAAALTALDSAIAVAAVGHALLGSALAAKSGGRLLLESRDGVLIQFGSDTIPAAAEIHGYLVVSN